MSLPANASLFCLSKELTNEPYDRACIYTAPGREYVFYEPKEGGQPQCFDKVDGVGKCEKGFCTANKEPCFYIVP